MKERKTEEDRKTRTKEGRKYEGMKEGGKAGR
jgi:hypothetical protein